MSDSKNTWGGAIAGAVAALVIVFGSWLVGGNQSAPTQFSGSSDSGWNATGSGCISVDGTCIIDSSGNVDGNITTDSLAVGTTSPLTLGHIEDSSATSTLTISSGGSAVGGRIILEDMDGAGCSEIAILNGTVAAKTVTCPTGI